MAQISRPFQIALVAVCLLAGIWLFALQGRSSNTSGSSAARPAPAPSASTSAGAAATASAPSTAAAEAKSAAAPTPVYHGAAPGVSGLSRAVAKAHQAVATSQQNAKQVEGASASTAPTTAPQSSSAAAPASKASAPASTTVKVTTVQKTSGKRGVASLPLRQLAVEAALAKGEMVVLLFWNRRGADDVAVHRAVAPLSKKGSKIFVEESPATQVASYGSVTRGVQVYATPTILIVNKRGKTTTLTGLQDTYSITQAIAEARKS